MPKGEVLSMDVYAHAAATMAEPLTTIVLLLSGRAVERANAFAAQFTDATVHLLRRPPRHGAEPRRQIKPDPRVVIHHCRNHAERHVVLRTLPRPGLIVEADRPKTGAKLQRLRQLHGYVRAGGIYAIEAIDRAPGDTTGRNRSMSVRSVLGQISALAAQPPHDRGATDWLDAAAQSLDSITYHGEIAFLTKSTPLPYKLRDDIADAVLTVRYGDASPLKVLTVRPAHRFTPDGSIVSHGRGPRVGRQRIDVPRMELRSYADATAYPRQLLRYKDFWLPDTFRHSANPRLHHRGLIRSGSELAVLRPQWTPHHRRRMSGSYFTLDSEFPGHFGHFTTEVISRLWGWDRALELYPDLRPLLSLRKSQQHLHPWQRDALEAFGIDPATVAIQRPDEILELEHLVAASPQFQNPVFVDDTMVETWRRITRGCEGTRPPVRTERLFVSRDPKRRGCLQAAEVEAFVTELGFAVVRPERFSYPEQVALFAQARVVAGYGGSGMFTMMHAPAARIVLISGDAYTAQNEALIGAANGSELHYFWGETQRVPRKRGEAHRAFSDHFTFDLTRHRRALAEALR